jgi:ABC-type branched-subunit amino acid transport system permease subunit
VVGFWPALVAPRCWWAWWVVVERFFLRRVHHHGHAHELLLTFGLSFIIAETIKLFFGNFPVDYRIPQSLDLRGLHGRRLAVPGVPPADGRRRHRDVRAIYLLLDAHARGHRGALGHLQAAHGEALGHNVPLVFMGVFGVGAALAGLAGAVAGAFYTTNPNMALELGVMVFVVVVVGGLGSLGGAMLASLLIGVSPRWPSAWTAAWPTCSRSSARTSGPRSVGGLLTLKLSSLSATIPFALMLLILLVRPERAHGREGESDETHLPLWAASRCSPRCPSCCRRAAQRGHPDADCRAVRLRLQPAVRAGRHAVFRPRGLLRRGRLRHRACHERRSAARACCPRRCCRSPGAACGLVFGVVAGWFATQRSGTYFAMITLAIAELVHALAPHLKGLVRRRGRRVDHAHAGLGPGLRLDHAGVLPHAGLGAGVGGLAVPVHAHAAGPAHLGLRENSHRLRFLGYNVHGLGMLVFAISAMFSGIAGGLQVVSNESANYVVFDPALSASVVLNTYIGGVKVFLGPAFGAALMTFFGYAVSDLTQSWLLYQGILFVLVMMFMPSGLTGLFTAPPAPAPAPRHRAVLPLACDVDRRGLLLSRAGVRVELLQRAFSQDYRAGRMQRGQWPPSCSSDAPGSPRRSRPGPCRPAAATGALMAGRRRAHRTWHAWPTQDAPAPEEKAAAQHAKYAQ